MPCQSCNGTGEVVTLTMHWTYASDHEGFWAEDADIVPCFACEPKEEAAPGWTPETAELAPNHEEPCPF